MEKYNFPQISLLIINELHTYLSCCDAKSKVSPQKKITVPIDNPRTFESTKREEKI